MRISINRDNIPVLFFLMVCVAQLWEIVVLGNAYYIRDLVYIFHPWKTYCAELIQKGEFPLWNSYAYCGMPLAANWQTGVFYPLGLFFYVFSFSSALKYYYLLHMFLMGYFAYLFGKKMGLSNRASVGMMVLFALNGYILTKTEFLSHYAVDSWMFCLLLLAGNPVLFAAALALAFFGGHQNALMISMIAGVYFLSVTKKREILSNTGKILLVFTALVSAQLLITTELVLNSSRYKGDAMSPKVAMTNSLDVSDLKNMVLPAGEQKADTGEKQPWEKTLYAGIIALMIISAGVARNIKDRRVWILMLMLAGGIVLAMGKNTPVYLWLYENLPFLKLLRYPVQYYFISITALTVLLGISLNDKWLKWPALVLMTIELIFWGHGINPSTDKNIYYNKNEMIEYMQKNLGGSRFILSPGTEKDRRIPSRSPEEGWERARGMLYNLTCMPYHLRNAYGTGEPLTLESVEVLVDKAYKQGTPQDARQNYAAMNVKYLLCRNELKNSNGYRKSHVSNDMIVYEVEKGQKEGAGVCDLYYPGWKARSAGKAVKVLKNESGFMEISEGKNRQGAELFYDPPLFRTGVLISLFGLIAITILGVKKLCAA